MDRRTLLALFGATAALPAWAQGKSVLRANPFRFGVTDVFLHDGAIHLWQDFLQSRLGMPVQIIQKSSYQEALEALRSDEMEAAWICGFPYVVAKGFVRLCAQPGWHGQPWYQSYLITSAGRTQAHTLADLQGDVFAFDDPLSNSGYLVPVVALRAMNQTPQRFFRGTFYTYSLHKVVEAVGSGLADSGTVDGYIWEILHQKRSPSALKTRIVAKSTRYGFPPIVTRKNLDHGLHLHLQQALLSAQNSEEGRRLLQSLDLRNFLMPQENWFSGIQELVEILDGTHAPIPLSKIYETA
ncbi:MAG: PhnD/SsuA/transferrin family substrate-binding protein [Thiomonas delicata]|uniref:Putative phosphite transport system-binding protein PtxB n=1 Tax=Thiomonas delicata TaxID=364030 RepID=A0A238D346_THIDL|nr:PhnD/SsuA/transferrin family substrate-binding protein [Thiomonas delicata]SBP87642.1 putative phosphite transport system-binding protein PtxB [Thiomonas delicata]